MELVARALAGERQAWAEIWDLHGPRLHAYARRLLSDPFEVDDVVADTFVSAAEHLGELRDADALRPWLYAICRRHVQRRWEARDRVRPLEQDALVRAADGQGLAVTAPEGGLDAAEARELLWAAADGLGPADRELLALLLDAHLESGDVAHVTGESPSAVYVRVSRLKDALGRAAGALLVARHHREDCAGLDALLRDWDGAYSTVWRKRIARHVDGCATCGSSRKTAAGALFGVAGFAPVLLLPALKERVLERVGEPELVPVSFAAGWPVPQRWERERRRLGVPALAAVVLLALLLAAVLLRPDSSSGTPEAAASEGPAPTATPSASAPAVLPPTPTTAAAGTPRSAAPPSPAPAVDGSPLTTTTASPTPSVTATRPPLPPAPTVALALSEPAIWTSCGSPKTTTATVTASGQGATTRLTWDGTQPGSATFTPSGSRVLGPYESVADPSATDTVTVTARVTDALGRTATAVRTFTVSVPAC